MPGTWKGIHKSYQVCTLAWLSFVSQINMQTYHSPAFSTLNICLICSLICVNNITSCIPLQRGHFALSRDIFLFPIYKVVLPLYILIFLGILCMWTPCTSRLSCTRMSFCRTCVYINPSSRAYFQMGPCTTIYKHCCMKEFKGNDD